MPKAKTRRSAAKRFTRTGTGKIRRGKSRTSHLLEWKTSATKRRLGKTVVVSKADRNIVRKMIPGI